MTIRRGFSSLLALVLAVIASNANAQQQTQPTASTASNGVNVALLDVAYIFKNHNGFKQSMDALRAKKKTIEDRVLAERNSLLKERNDGLAAYKPGTAPYKQMEERLANKAADAQVKMELQKKELLEEEAQVYLRTYNDVLRSVQGIASQHRIQLVLRYDSQQIDPNNPSEILKGINRAVIHQHNLDITGTVLQMVNRNTATPTP